MIILNLLNEQLPDARKYFGELGYKELRIEKHQNCLAWRVTYIRRK